MSENSMTRVAVVSSAQTEFRKAWSNLQHVDLLSAVVEATLKGSGLRIEDVDFVVDCGSDVLDGRSISNCGFLGAMGAHHKEEARVEEDGLFGAIYGVNKIVAGSASVALVIGYSKPSESDVAAYYSTIAEPFYQRPIGIDHVSAAGLLASQYLSLTHATEEDLLRITRSAWSKARSNQRLVASELPSDEEIERASYVAEPLREFQLARPVDGAVAVLLACEEVARKVTEYPVWITGMGAATESHCLADRTPGEFAAAQEAARVAQRRAGITDPRSVDFVEVSASSVAAEALVVEALGLAARGHAVDAYLDGKVDINPSGGSVPADPIMATGLVRLHEASSRLSGRSGGRSSGARAFVHGAGGLNMQNHCVFAVEVER